MGMSVNTNIASLNAQRNLLKTGNALDLAIQRLSSGLRINSAKDDAAGLAISNRMTSQIEGTNVAIRNSNDAISLAQTGEGALQEYTNILQRIRDLAVQSANDTNSDSDRAALNAEVEQLKEELNRIGNTAEFNGVKLFDGVKTNFTFQTGANLGDTVEVTLSAVTTDKIGAAATSGISSMFESFASTIGAALTNGLTAGASTQEMNAGDLVINGFAVGASIGSDDTSSVEFAESSAIAKAAAINAVQDTTGVTATVTSNRVEGTEITVLAALTAASMQINGVTISGISAGAATNISEVQTQLEAVANQINTKEAATGVRAEVAQTEDGFRIDLVAADGRNITLEEMTANTTSAYGMIGTGATGEQTTYVGNFTLNSLDGGDIVLTSDTGFIENAGLKEGTYSGTQAITVSRGFLASDTNMVTSNELASGDVTINGVSIGPTLEANDTASTTGEAASAISKAAAINLVQDQTGVTATVNANVVSGEVIDDTNVSSTFGFTLNGVLISGGGGSDQTQSDQLNALVDAVNAQQGLTGVRAEKNGTAFNLIADDGRNISFTAASTGMATAGIYFYDPARGYNSDHSAMASTSVSVGQAVFLGSFTLTSGSAIEVGTLTGETDNAGLRIGSFGATEEGQLIKDIDISTVAGANDAITALDNALTQVDGVRSDLGAVQNRFESTVSYLANLAENLSAARSRIRDADFALETSNLTKAQILQQAGTAMLAQANALSQNVLSLLG